MHTRDPWTLSSAVAILSVLLLRTSRVEAFVPSVKTATVADLIREASPSFLSISRRHKSPSPTVVRARFTSKETPSTSTNATDIDCASKHANSVENDGKKHRAVISGIEAILDEESPRMPSDHFDTSKLVSVNEDRDHLWKDPAMKVFSSELGVKQLLGEQADDASVAQAIMMERTLDTLEDVAVHLRRLPVEFGFDAPQDDQDRKTVVVLGSGWGAHAFMKVADCSKIRLIVVSPSNHFVFTPMLASVRSMPLLSCSLQPSLHGDPAAFHYKFDCQCKLSRFFLCRLLLERSNTAV